MPLLRPSAYGLPSGGRLEAGIAAQWPAWRATLAPWQWGNLSAAAMSNTIPSPAPTGAAKDRVEAWNGVAVLDTSVYMAGVGGHADWWGNEGYRTDLGVDSPGAPELLRAPTAAAYYTTDQDYYSAEPDGRQRPTSSHTYYALHPDVTRRQILRIGVGSGAGSGNYRSPNVDAFDLVSGDWLPANALADCPEGILRGLMQCRHPVTGDIYVAGETKLWRWNHADRSWTDLGLFPPGKNGTAAESRCGLIDVARDRLVILGDAYATPTGVLTFGLTSGTWGTAAVTGTYAALLVAQGGSAAFHLPSIDRYVARRSWSAATGGEGNGPIQLGGGEILLVNPDTWEVTEQATTGGSSIPATYRGVFGLFQHMPSLGGCVLRPLGTGGDWFLATE